MPSRVAMAGMKRGKRDPGALSMDVVARYASAKSRRDVNAALRVCHEDFSLETVAFGISGTGKLEVAAQLGLFFATFPDYTATIEGEAVAHDVVTAWGTIRATMRGPFGSFAPTGRGFALPFACVFPLRDGLLAGERFFFDLNAMCEQLGLPVERVAAELRAYRGEGREELRRDGVQEFVAKFTDFWRPPLDVERLTDLVHPDVRLMSSGLSAADGIAAAKEAFQRLFALMPDFRVELERWSAADDAVFLEITLRATMDVEMPRVCRRVRRACRHDNAGKLT